MKRIVISCCLIFLILAGNQVSAQDSKVKTKEDKTKIKEGDDAKEKDKTDKTKVKDGDYKEKAKDDKMKMKDDNAKIKMKGQDGMNLAYPYTATYSSNFIMGNPANAKMVLDLWKDWDDNAFDRHDYFADTLVMYMPDGSFTKGKAANMEAAKKYRGGMTSAKSTIDAWMPLRSTDRNQDWVAVWGTETDTWADGKTETKEIHEIWRINKDGKIDLMRQFTAVPTKQQ
jgi:hypothetical protein